jgi:chlorobactene glucosyltransferase
MIWAWLAVGAYSLIVLAWLGRWLLLCYRKPEIPMLRYDAPGVPGEDARFVSIIVPARNESANIRSCLTSLLALDYPRFEVIVVDDRSTDDTADIVRELARDDDRLRLLQVDELPSGWTGKTHALQCGVERAKGGWLLFVDADTTLHRRNLRVLLGYAMKENADLVSLIPGQRCESFWEKVVQPVAGITLMVYYWLPKVNSADHRSSAFANGQYILIKRRAYVELGGHEAVRGELLEDIALARKVKSMGGSIRVAMTPLLTVTRMYTSLREIVRGWSRIFYAAVPGRAWRLLMSLVCFGGLHLSGCVVTLAAAVALVCGFTTPLMWTVFGLGITHQAAIALVMRPLYRLSHSPRWHILGYSLACGVMMAIMCRAYYLSFTHKVTWRGTTYGPEMLRKAA